MACAKRGGRVEGGPQPPPGAGRRLAGLLAGKPGIAFSFDVSLARYTTFRIGGPAELFAEVTSERALAALLSEVRAASVPFQLLGLGSNVLIPDAGLPGVVARLGGELARVRIRGERVSAGGAASLPRLARRTAVLGLCGLEALSGFPSTVGGGVYMNAGCYGTEIKDTLIAVRVVERSGARRRLTVQSLEPRYRETILARTGAIVTRALFLLRQGDAAAALARIEELNRRRWASLPSGSPNAGSVFKNPPGEFAGRLIEACGLKGSEHGGAQISREHANVIVNRGGARAEDVLELMLVARNAVANRFGVELVPELVLAGDLASRWRAETRTSPTTVIPSAAWDLGGG